MNSFTEKMLNSPYVVAKPQEDHNLISLNFSRKAFQKNIWNAQTIHARGLFVDATTGDVKMRSYNKFFYIDTDPTGEHLQFPAVAYKKYNGFLGIMSVVDGDIVLASKSTTQGPFKELFQEIWNTLDDNDVNTSKTSRNRTTVHSSLRSATLMTNTSSTSMRTISTSSMLFLIPTILLVLLLTHSSHKQSYSK